MRGVLAWMAVASACSCRAEVESYRPDQSPVLIPPTPVAAVPQPDPAGPFEQAYRRAGRPSVALLWNRAIDDKASETVVDETVSREETHRSGGIGERRVQGAGESTLSMQAEGRGDRVRTDTRGRRVVDESARKTMLAERVGVMLQRGFVAEMKRGGVRFVDRALLMRTTAAAGRPGDGDSKMLEIDALLRHADLVLEVLMVEDADAPTGQGFDVRVKDVRRGEELATLYSRAVPASPPVGNGAWVAGAAGYEFRLPPPAPAPGPAEMGAALARDVMRALGSSLPLPTGPSRRGAR